MIVDGRIVDERASAAAAAAPEDQARPEARPRIATLCIPDVAAHEAAQGARELETARRRRVAFERGGMTSLSGPISRTDPSSWG